jgi:hypothetical protein
MRARGRVQVFLDPNDVGVTRVQVERADLARARFRHLLDPHPSLRHLVTSSEEVSVERYPRMRVEERTSPGSGMR